MFYFLFFFLFFFYEAGSSSGLGLGSGSHKGISNKYFLPFVVGFFFRFA